MRPEPDIKPEISYKQKMSEKIYLDRNENHFGPAPKCFQVLKKPNFKKMSAYSRDFARGVKSRLSERLSEDYNIPEEQLLLGYGGEDILKQAVHCYLRKEDTILIPSLSWWYYKSIAAEMKGKQLEYPIVEGEDEFTYDVDRLIELYQEHKPKIILIASPNNPTGNMLQAEQLERILLSCPDSVIVLDEAYSLFSNTDKTYISHLIQKYPKLLIIRTFSKYYALAGLRIGYAFMGAELAHFEKFSARYLGYNRLSERIALAALDSDDYYNDMRSKMNADIQRYFDELNMIPGFKAYRSHANFILVKIPEEVKAPLKEYLEGKNLIIKFMNEEILNTHLRISIGTPKENARLIKAIKQFAKKHM